MEFRLSKDKTPKIVLKANNLELDDRWILKNPGFFMRNEVGNSVKDFVCTKSMDKKLRRTRLALAEDDFLDRTVLVKTVCYDIQDLSQAVNIRMKRRIIEAQIEILNALRSNMLPEPLDFFEITNDFDHFANSISDEFKNTEPVLILDYIPGEVLADRLRNSYDKTFYRTEESKGFSKTVGQVNIEMIMRLIGDILTFEMEMYEKGYAYTTLSPDHIVLLGDNKPRFIGIGRICPVSSDRYDSTHINFGRHLKAYGAPEFNQSETVFGLNASVKANISYNLGVLIASIVLAKTDFDERLLRNGAYDYHHDIEDREAIKNSWRNKGKQLDTLLYKLMDPDPARRQTDFEAILHELSIISGDAQNESQKATVYYGKIKFFAHDKGFGYVTSDNQDYRVDLTKLDYIPSGDGDQSGQEVMFTANVSKKGQLFVREFVKPKPALVWPRKVSKPQATVSSTTPKPTPTPAPSKPQPVPKPQPTPAKPQPVPRPEPQPQPQRRPQPAQGKPQQEPRPQPQPAPKQTFGTPQKKKGLFSKLLDIIVEDIKYGS